MTPSAALLGVGLSVVLGAAPLVFAARLWWVERKRARHWRPARAVVVNHVVVPDSDGPITYPVFAFTTSRGASFEVRSRYASGSPGYALGDYVTIRYDPNDSRQAEIIGASRYHFARFVALGVGSLVILAVFFIRLAR